VSFRVNTPLTAAATGTGAVVTGETYALHIVPLNWCPTEVTAEAEGLDSNLTPAHLVRLVAPAADNFRLLTALVVTVAEAVLPASLVYDGISPKLRMGSLQVSALTADDALTLTVENEGTVTEYHSVGDRWMA
jgi:hypothetical protein